MMGAWGTRIGSSGRHALGRTGRLAMRTTKRSAKIGGIAGVGAAGGYYMGRRSSATNGLTSQNKGMYGY